ncbi:MAG: PTS sugar transporter subunit IIC [Anaerorhabdus sp.]
MGKFYEWMERKFVPVAAKIGSQKHLVAIRDSFIAIMPLTMAGSFAVLLNVFFRDLWADGLFNVPAIPEMFGWLISINGNVWWGTIAMFSLAFAFSFGYHLSKAYDVNPIAGALISFASLIAVTPQGIEGTWGNIPYAYTNAAGLFTALIVGGIATMIYIALTKRNITIKLPESVPPAVSKAFAAIIPGTVAIYVWGIVAYVVSANASWLGASAIGDLISYYLQSPFMNVAAGLPIVLLTSLLVGLFWFFGLHGVNVLGPVIEGVYGTMLLENQTLYQTAGRAADGFHLWTKGSFDAFVFLGGSGCTLALIIAILFLSKKDGEKAVAKLAAPMGVFNINEPVIFGLPIVLSPMYFIPFVFISPILTAIAYAATYYGLVPPVILSVPWVTPPVISAFLATGGSITAAVLALLNLALATVIWAIFVKLANKDA